MKANNPHAHIDRANLALNRATADKIRAHPELVEIARANLRRWREQNGGELVPAHQEWELVLRFLNTQELAEFLVSDTPKANRLRQSSPMTGILSETERLAVLRTSGSPRRSSASGMEENTGHLTLDLLLGPLPVHNAQPRRLPFASRPVKLFGQLQPPLGRHPAKRLVLFRPGAFIGEHSESVSRSNQAAQGGGTQRT